MQSNFMITAYNFVAIFNWTILRQFCREFLIGQFCDNFVANFFFYGFTYIKFFFQKQFVNKNKFFYLNHDFIENIIVILKHVPSEADILTIKLKCSL